MVLSSQTSRSGTGRSNMFARRTHKKKPWLLIFMVIGAVVFACWWFYLREEGKGAGGAATAHDVGGSMKVAAHGGVGVGDAEGSQANSSLPSKNETAMLPSGGDGETKVDEQAGKSRNSSITMGEHDNRTPSSVNSGVTNSDTNAKANTAGKENMGGVERPSDSFGADPSQEVRRLVASADAMFARGQMVEARLLFNEALQDRGVGRLSADIRKKMGEINAGLIFSPLVADGDPYAERYVIQSGDRLVNLAKKAHVDWRFLARINNIDKPERIRIGQTIKIVNGPFHVVIDKSDYRMDVYIGGVDKQGRRMFVRFFRVGLGAYDSTPVGSWIVRKNSKAINPAWTNPRTGEHFSRDDPKNPIGEYWVGLRGLDSETSKMSGYGIHGTIDPDSIGRQSSMGCVRMGHEDIAMVYEMLVPGESTVITQR